MMDVLYVLRSEKGSSQDEVTSNSEEIKSIALYFSTVVLEATIS